jgi:hypothetical protein
MRFGCAAFGLLLLLAVNLCAQDSSAQPTLEQLRGDYNASTLVVRVIVKDTTPLTKDHHYACIANGRFVEAFKGENLKGKRIAFYVRAEAGCDTQYNGDRFAFLLRRLNRQINAWVYEQWSIYPFTKETLTSLRKLRKTGGG